MKFLRSLAKFFLLLFVLSAVITALAFVPAVQTWWLGRKLANHPELHLSVESVWARFGKIDAEGVRVELPGALLTMPTVETEAPVISTLRTGNLPFRRIVAKGWTLDLRNLPKDDATAETAPASEENTEPKPTTSGTSPAAPEAIALDFKGLLSGRKLPCDFSADQIVLEGDVLIPVAGASDPARVHVVLEGRGIGFGQKSDLTLTVDAPSVSPRIPDFNAKGALSLSMDTPRSFHRIEWKPALVLKGGKLPKDLPLSVVLSAVREAGAEIDRVSLKDGDRELASASGRFEDGKNQITGDWKVEFGQPDLLSLVSGTPFPAIPLSGAGTFDSDGVFQRLHLTGNVSADPKHSGALTAAAGLVGIETANTTFDLVRSGDTVHVNQLRAAFIGVHSLATVVALQPFDYDVKTKSVTPSAPAADAFEGTVNAVPLTWLSALIQPWVISGGEVTGEFSGKLANGGFSLHSNKPIQVAHASLQRDGNGVVRDLNLSIALSAAVTPKDWRIQGAPVAVSNAGGSWGEFDLSLSRPHDLKYPLTIETKGHADVAALSGQPGFTALRELPLDSLSGDVVTTIGQWVHFAGDVTLTGRGSHQTVAAKLNADFRNDRSFVFRVPITLTNGTTVTEIATQGSCLPSKYGHEVNGSVSGKDVSIENLRLIGPLLTRWIAFPEREKAATVAFPTTSENPAPPCDSLPFWGDAVGRVTLSFEHLRVGTSDLQDLHANLRLEPKGIHFEQGRYQLSNHLAEAEAAITFDPKAEVRYQVTGKFDDGEVDADPLFGPPTEGQDPLLHGKFAVVSTLEGRGNTLDELTTKTQQRFQLKSTSGIVRFLKTHVTGLNREKETKLGDAADVVGTLFGKLAGVKQNSIIKQQVKLSKATEAVLNFSYDCAEIGYSELTITAVRGRDGVLHILDLSMIAPDEHLTGTGELATGAGAPAVKAPLRAELRFAVRDKTAELLAGTGLLSDEKDGLGYTLFKKPFRVTGNLQHPDVSEWHDLLYEAALAGTETKKR